MKRQTAGYSNLASLCSTGNSRIEYNPPGTVIAHGQERYRVLETSGPLFDKNSSIAPCMLFRYTSLSLFDR
jgi:hypothetical protein